jgi:CO/xanthine dehydrogenase FAD-binding subunit
VQNVIRARSVNEAAWLLAEAAPGTRVIAGGTDLMLHLARGKARASALIDIRRAGMDHIHVTEKAIRVGACATASAMAKSAALQKMAGGLWEAAATLSVPQIRNLATLGGNIANASPAADLVPCVLAMGGILEVRSGDAIRALPAEKFALAPGRTVLQQQDLLADIILPRWPSDAFHHFVKVGFRDAQIIAVCSMAFSCTFDGEEISKVGIALGSVAPTVVRAKRVERFLMGKKLTRAVGEEAMRLLAQDISPIDDVRSTRAYRLRVAAHFLGDTLGRAHLHRQGLLENNAPPSALAFLKDPAPRPPARQEEKTRPLRVIRDERPLGHGDVTINAVSNLSYTEAEAVKEKPAKKKPAEKKPAKKKPAKKKPAKKKPAKKKPAKKKPAKKKPAKKKPAKKKPAKKKSTGKSARGGKKR